MPIILYVLALSVEEQTNFLIIMYLFIAMGLIPYVHNQNCDKIVIEICFAISSVSVVHNILHVL